MSGASPVWQLDGSSLYHYDVSAVPWPLENASVQCVITSPPYYALRVYEGVEPSIWGGSADCEHAFDDSWTPNQNAGGGVTFKQRTNAGSYQTRGGGTLPKKPDGPRGILSAICGKCGAWRGTLGNEPSPDCLAWARGEPPCAVCYICHIRTIFHEIGRVLHSEGVVVWNIGDTYNGSGGAGGDYNAGGLKDGQPRYPGTKLRPSGRRDRSEMPPPTTGAFKAKDLLGIPYRTALAVQADGWYWRSICPWIKPNGMPESVRDRPSRGHEEFLLFSKCEHPYFDIDGWRAPSGRNRRTGDWWIESLEDQIEEAEEYARELRRLRHSDGIVTDGAGDPCGMLCRTRGSESEHYAAYNRALIRPWMRATTSEAGCCPECRAPYRRITEMREDDRQWQRQSGSNRSGEYNGQSHKPGSPGVQRPSDVKRNILAGMKQRRTITWEPSSQCDAGPAALCTVLDPFAGTGTTGVEAIAQGRQFVGLEASEKYCQIAAERIESLRTQPALPALGSAAAPRANGRLEL